MTWSTLAPSGSINLRSSTATSSAHVSRRTCPRSVRRCSRCSEVQPASASMRLLVHTSLLLALFFPAIVYADGGVFVGVAEANDMLARGALVLDARGPDAKPPYLPN